MKCRKEGVGGLVFILYSFLTFKSFYHFTLWQGQLLCLWGVVVYGGAFVSFVGSTVPKSLVLLIFGSRGRVVKRVCIFCNCLGSSFVSQERKERINLGGEHVSDYCA